MAQDGYQHRDFALQPHIQRGDMAPWWNQGPHRFVFDQFAGRYIVLSFYRGAGDTVGSAALHALDELRDLVANDKAWLFGVSLDSDDHTVRHVDAVFPSVEFLWDPDGTVYRAYGIGPGRIWIVLDPMLRVIEAIPFMSDGSDIRSLADLMHALPPPSRFIGFDVQAPVLVLPDVFEPAFCRHLIDVFEQAGGRESGFMQEVGGKAVEIFDPAWKRRKDHLIDDAALFDAIKERISRRVGLMMRQAFHFQLTRIERQLIARYSAGDDGHFGPHRDNTVKATEHRRFAMSINLNEDYEGGEVSFPEYGPKGFKMPVGAALIFSAALLHRVSKVTSGSRYVFVPFLHDEAAEQVRLANLQFLARPA
ncbi:MAG TPA: 2OG-Fe(II) oxygenase [Acetobacteraceae bacterium]|jgi:predicted 2-oxoglutarate/Fe(II)-dependent dioxygenase YbiX/peroxiredoxin